MYEFSPDADYKVTQSNVIWRHVFTLARDSAYNCENSLALLMHALNRVPEKKANKRTHVRLPSSHHKRTLPTGACGRHACAASARASPARKIDTMHTLLSSTKTLENVAPVGVVMNGLLCSKHATPWHAKNTVRRPLKTIYFRVLIHYKGSVAQGASAQSCRPWMAF